MSRTYCNKHDRVACSECEKDEGGSLVVARLDTERIVAAAVHTGGVIISVPRPGRHHDVTRWLGEQNMFLEQRNQGFLTSTGRFVKRVEACKIARAAGQVDETKKTNPKDTLFSEDLW